MITIKFKKDYEQTEGFWFEQGRPVKYKAGEVVKAFKDNDDASLLMDLSPKIPKEYFTVVN